ncbi:hypothetical protein OG875_11715 [Streptomyces sp. NBC_01498]|uniref:hypothetical protein n=1 Tax=Streptomyces sp. NBC_01498 TaxID=2975870 RepID=UPI002E7C4D78|nr:hypothetical protein [Streptomyces sp. NBC_01498]WTL25201.1 hypothetical protein OG875_11715 [Streptomyces sp. NBC_01498]
MTESPVPPELARPADRPTGLKDPVRTVRQLSRFEYARRRPRTHVDHALVFVTAQATYDVFTPPHRPRRSDAPGKQYIALYEVDMALHHFRLGLPLPSAVDAFQFEAVADLTWQVLAPDKVIDCGVRDVPALLGPRVGQLLRHASRLYPIDAVREAEAAVQRSVHASPPLAEDEGLRVGCTVRLRTDEGERSQSERLRVARHQSVAAPPEHRVRMEGLRRDLEAQEYERKISAEKIAFYEHHLAKGGLAALVIHLVQHPEDTHLVVEHLRKDQSELIANQLHLVDKILSEHGLESHQLEGTKNYVVETINRVLTSSSPPPYIEPGTDSPPVSGAAIERSQP